MAIQTIKATMQMRRGAEENFDPDQMTAGEWAVSMDSKKVWMCFAPGIVRRMATYETFEQDMIEIQTILATCQNIQTAVERFEELAQQHATQAEEWSVASKSWAVGGTNTREGEDTNNSKYWSEQSKSEADRAKDEADRAASIAGFDIDSELSTTSTNPVQNKVITEELNKKLGKDGDASKAIITFEQATERANVQSGDSLEIAFAKLSKFCEDLKPHAFAKLANNFLVNTPGIVALDADAGRVLKEGQSSLQSRLDQINSNLGIINSTLITSNVTNAITLPANMTTGTELCRTVILQPGLYLIGYRMSNYNLDTVYHINLSTTGNYASILLGQNGVDVVRLSSPNALVITAQNRSDKPYAVNASGNNRLFALQLNN